MGSDDAPKHTSTRLSLYANLLDQNTGHETSNITPGALASEDAAQSVQALEAPSEHKNKQISSAALRFQPSRRPQALLGKPKTKPVASKSIQRPDVALVLENSSDPQQSASGPSRVTNVLDWTASTEQQLDEFPSEERRQRGGRKKRKKQKDDSAIRQNWDDIYDPSRPNTYDEYLASDERYLELRDWKQRLHAHHISSNIVSKASMVMTDVHTIDGREPFHVQPLPQTTANDNEAPALTNKSRFTIEHMADSIGSTALDTLENPRSMVDAAVEVKEARAPTISKDPILYSNATAQKQSDDVRDKELLKASAADSYQPQSSRPGQKNFATRLMEKYGWTKGTGLGATGSGIQNPLMVKLDKQKNHASGSTVDGSGGRGKIINNQESLPTPNASASKFGSSSNVILLRHMLDGLNINVQDGTEIGDLLQEIGEECGEQYGTIERIFIHEGIDESPAVFLKFVSQVSALRAVHSLDGRTFNGNIIEARFYESAKFDSGNYDFIR